MERETIQPDYAKWLAVKEGMSYAHVLSLLGQPQKVLGVTRKPGEQYHLRFGHLHLTSVPNPSFYDFTILFREDDTVRLKTDPFGGIFSKDGRPSKPRIINPVENATYSHYPRVLDLRWQPCSGVYPIMYEVEMMLGWHEPKCADIEWGKPHTNSIRPVKGPHMVSGFPGAQPGRFRVRGLNAKGEGGWSEFRQFEFLI